MMNRSSNGHRMIWLEEVDSTNSYMKRLLQELDEEEGLLVVADYQTGGRGQMGSGWSSEKGQNLLFSLLIYPENVAANAQFIISRIASLAVKKTLDQFTDDIRIKWPNDIYWREKKICGMLIENDLFGKRIQNSVIGIGLNVNQESFSPDLPNPVSLRQITGSPYDRVRLIDFFTLEFFELYRNLQRGKFSAIEEEYMLNLYRKNEYHWYEDKNGRFQAIIEDVLPTGHLIMNTLEGEARSYAFKEIKYANVPESKSI